MKNLSDFNDRKEWEEFVWLEFLQNLNKIKSTQQLKEVLELVLSEKEKKLIIKRIISASLISQGKKYREIGDILWLSHSTISAVKKSFLKKSAYRGYQYYINQNTQLKNNSQENKIEKITIDDLGEATIDLMDWFARFFILIRTHGKDRWKFLDQGYKENLKYRKK